MNRERKKVDTQPCVNIYYGKEILDEAVVIRTRKESDVYAHYKRAFGTRRDESCGMVEEYRA